jgi:hypothetical protein
MMTASAKKKKMGYPGTFEWMNSEFLRCCEHLQLKLKCQRTHVLKERGFGHTETQISNRIK